MLNSRPQRLVLEDFCSDEELSEMLRAGYGEKGQAWTS